MNLYKEFLRANDQCELWKRKYSELSAALEERERHICERQGILNEDHIFIRIKDVQEKCKPLQSYYAKYNFWKGEVERYYQQIHVEVLRGEYRANRLAYSRSGEGIVRQADGFGH